MLPCHRCCVSPDALAQDMGKRRLIFLCQVSLAVTFVRGCLSDSHKHLTVYLALPIMAARLYLPSVICMFQRKMGTKQIWKDVDIQISSVTNLSAMKAGLFAESFCVASSLGTFICCFYSLLCPDRSLEVLGLRDTQGRGPNSGVANEFQLERIHFYYF